MNKTVTIYEAYKTYTDHVLAGYQRQPKSYSEFLHDWEELTLEQQVALEKYLLRDIETIQSENRASILEGLLNSKANGSIRR